MLKQIFALGLYFLAQLSGATVCTLYSSGQDINWMKSKAESCAWLVNTIEVMPAGEVGHQLVSNDGDACVFLRILPAAESPGDSGGSGSGTGTGTGSGGGTGGDDGGGSDDPGGTAPPNSVRVSWPYSSRTGDYCTGEDGGGGTGGDGGTGQPAGSGCTSGEDVAGCMKQGTPAESGTVPNAKIAFSYKAFADSNTGSGMGGTAAACPKDVEFKFGEHEFQLTYKPLCDSAAWVKPMVLLVGSFVALFIVYEALRSRA